MTINFKYVFFNFVVTPCQLILLNQNICRSVIKRNSIMRTQELEVFVMIIILMKTKVIPIRLHTYIHTTSYRVLIKTVLKISSHLQLLIVISTAEQSIVRGSRKNGSFVFQILHNHITSKNLLVQTSKEVTYSHKMIRINLLAI